MSDPGLLAGQVAVVSRGSATRATLMRPEDVAEALMLQRRLPRGVLLKRTVFFPTSDWH